MATSNPYDRRDRPRPVMDPFAIGGPIDLGPNEPYDLLADGRRAYPGFTVARLEELLRDEFARGFNCGEGTLEQQMDERLPEIRRKIWEEGHAAGILEGRAALLAELAEERAK